MRDEIKQIELKKKKLIENNNSIIISVNEDDVTDLGYAPYIFYENYYYIFVSELSTHVKLLLKKNVGTFMIINDETNSQNIWARIRLKFSAKIEVIIRESEDFGIICEKIRYKHGKTMNLIKQFSDFHLIKIIPSRGTFIFGFGNAYNLEGQYLNVINKIRP
jgi:putative heme iron utilization protein